MELKPADKRGLEMLKIIKQKDPNWKENLKNGYYNGQQLSCDGDGPGVVILLCIIGLGLVGVVELINFIWK